MRRTIAVFAISTAVALPATAVQRHPTGVNVNTQGPATVFITYGGLRDQAPAEAFWCGELIPATPAIGFMCKPDTIFGRLPLRLNRSRASGTGGLTDIMTIPANVIRRAWEAAAAGATSSFYYVRRFISLTGGPDEYVFVTCRLAGGGARTPLALLDVRLAFDTDAVVLAVEPGATPPAISADLTYTGTGRLIGRWEVVQPGEDPPHEEDLLSAAALPVELRPLQRRWTEVGRFNVFLPPSGRYRLAGPDPRRLPTAAQGLYLVLLRIEASNDKEGDSSLAAAGAGSGVVHTGGVAGFPIPPLRYYVGSATTPLPPLPAGELAALLPAAGATLAALQPVVLSWTPARGVAFYRIEVMAGGDVVAAALLPAHLTSYSLPPLVRERAPLGELRWRVEALDLDGAQVAATEWRTFTLAPAPR